MFWLVIIDEGCIFLLCPYWGFNSVQAIMDSFLQLFVFFVVVIWCSVMGACHFSKSTISSHWQLKNGAAFTGRTETSSTKQLSSRPVSFTSLWILQTVTYKPPAHLIGLSSSKQKIHLIISPPLAFCFLNSIYYDVLKHI